MPDVTFSDQGAVTVAPKGTFDIQGAVTVASGATFDDEGTVTVEGTLEDAGLAANAVTVGAGATLGVSGILIVEASAFLDIKGEVEIHAGAIFKDQGTVKVEKSGLLSDVDAITVGVGALLDVAGQLTEGTGGVQDVYGSLVIETSGDLDIFGSVTIEQGATYTPLGTVTVESGGSLTNLAGEPPAISVSTDSIELGTSTDGIAGVAQSFTVSGSDLIADILMTAPLGVELSDDGGTSYSTTLDLAESGGTVGVTTILARLAATAQVGPVTGKIGVASTDAIEQDITVSGTVNPIALTAISTVSPDPRDIPVPSIEVTFNGPIDTGSLSSGALGLTDNGGAVTVSGVTLSLVSGTTYAISGLAPLTKVQGSYTLTFNAADIQDQNGSPGSGSMSTSWLMDTTPPTSTVSPLPRIGSGLVFPVTVTGTVPNEPAGSPTVDITSFAVYVSTNGGPWTLWLKDLTPSSSTANTASANYTGTSNTVYAFYTIATDNAGNTQAYKPAVEASTDLPNLDTPATQVTSSSVYNGDGTFTLSLSGTDAGGSGLAYFEVYVSIGAGTPVLIGPAIPAGVDNSSGTYQATTTYVMPSSDYGPSNTYKFYSVGIDAAGLEEPMHAMYDVSFSESYSEPAPANLAVSSLAVENGAAERSFIRSLDVNFNDANPSVLQSIVNSVNSPTVGNPAELTLTQYNLNGGGPPTPVPLKGLLDVIDNAIEIDFGTGGIGGNPSTTSANGYYTLTFSPTGSQPGVGSTHHFYRLLGDVNGDGTVDQNDLNEIAAARGQSVTQIATAINQPASGLTALSMDGNGDGSVNTTDLALATKSKGNSLGKNLPLG